MQEALNMLKMLIRDLILSYDRVRLYNKLKTIVNLSTVKFNFKKDIK
jgi:hypothetical protein